MFRFQIYSLTVILLLGGGASFVLDSLDQVGARERLLEEQIGVTRLGAEVQIDKWVSSCVDSATELGNQPAILGQLKALQQSAPKERRAVFEGALAELVPFIEKWREKNKGINRPDWVYVVDAEGRVLLRTQKPQERGDSIAGIPIVRTMLGGAALDDVWVLDDGIYVTAAAASLVDGVIAGGVVLGYKLDGSRTTGMAAGLPQVGGVSPGLAFIWSGKSIGQSFILNQGTQVPASDDLSVYGEASMAFAPFPFLAPQMGRYLGTASRSPGWPSKLLVAVNLQHCPAFEDVAIRQIFIIGITLLLVLVSLFWGISIRRAVVKPLGAIVDHLSSVQQGGSVGLLPEAALKDPYKRLGTLINMLISKGGSRPASGKTDLSDILGSSAATSSSVPDQGLAGDGGFGSSSAPASADPAVASLPADALSVPPAAEGPDDESSRPGIASLFADTDNDIAPPPPSVPSLAPVSAPVVPAQAISQPPSAATAPPLEPVSDEDAAANFMASLSSGSFASGPQSPTALPENAPSVASPPPAAPPPAVASQPDFNPERTVMVQVPDELLAASASAAAAPPPPAVVGGGEFNPDATVVAEIPQDLLRAAISDPPGDPDEAHFTDVYEQFIATRKECGEPVADLSYDRFMIKLKKNREQLINKYGCRTVRFQVYVKSGKAALKAVPVRD